MSNPSGLRYAPTHEWAKLDGDVVTVGITKFAVEQLTEPTFLELPAAGKALTREKPRGIIESVKSTADIYSPVNGTVVERNESLVDDPKTKRKGDLTPVNDDPFVWFYYVYGFAILPPVSFLGVFIRVTAPRGDARAHVAIACRGVYHVASGGIAKVASSTSSGRPCSATQPVMPCPTRNFKRSTTSG